MACPILCGNVREDPDRKKMYDQQRDNDEFPNGSIAGESIFRHLDIRMSLFERYFWRVRRSLYRLYVAQRREQDGAGDQATG